MVKFVLVRQEDFYLKTDFTWNNLGVYVKIESALGNGQTTYVSLDVYYSPTNLWIGQILYTGNQLSSTPNVVVRNTFHFQILMTNTMVSFFFFREHQ